MATLSFARAATRCGVADYRRRPVESVGEFDFGAADREVVAALRAGDEGVFASLVDRYCTPMLSVARAYVATREAAEDVVQETWIGVIEGIDRFEGRSSLKTWMYRILVNRARTRGEREARTSPFSRSLASPAPEEGSGWGLRPSSRTDSFRPVIDGQECGRHPRTPTFPNNAC